MMSFQLWVASVLLWFGSYLWVGQIFGVTLLFFVAYKAIGMLFKIIQKHFKVSKNWVVEICIKTVKKPMRFLFVLMCTLVIIDIFNTNTMLFSGFHTVYARNVVFVIFCAWSIIRFTGFVQEYMLYHSHKIHDKTSVLAFGQIGNALTIVISSLIAMQIMGVNFAGLLAFGGFSGIAVGFAAKDLLANFFGAIMIYMDKPFKVGDWIKSPEKEIEGEVESISWRQTKIITFEKRPIYVPNSVFSTIVIENASRMTHRRLDEIIGIRYDDISKANDIVDDIKEMLIEHSKVDNSQSLVVGVVKFAASSVDIMLYCFTTTTTLLEFSKVRHEILLGTSSIITKHGAEIAFPTSTVHVASTPENVVTLKENV